MAVLYKQGFEVARFESSDGVVILLQNKHGQVKSLGYRKSAERHIPKILVPLQAKINDMNVNQAIEFMTKKGFCRIPIKESTGIKYRKHVGELSERKRNKLISSLS